MNLITTIKLLFTIKSPVTDLVNEIKGIKSGWHDWAWWTSATLTLLTLAGTLQHFLPPQIGLSIVVGLTLIYSLERMVKNAGTPGVQPLLLSTRFWIGVLGLVSTALISLKTGGIDAKWIESALAVIGTIMAAAQNVGATQPKQAAVAAGVPVSDVISGPTPPPVITDKQ